MAEQQKGRKDDSGKLRWDLLSFDDVEGIVEVFTWAITKKDPPYEPNSWQQIEDGENRYFAAIMRHLVDHQRGKVYDDESGLLTLQHVATNALILLHFVKQRLANEQYIEEPLEFEIGEDAIEHIANTLKLSKEAKNEIRKAAGLNYEFNLSPKNRG